MPDNPLVPIAIAAPSILQMRCIDIRGTLHVLEDHVMKFQLGLRIESPSNLERGKDYDVLVNVKVFPRAFLGKTW